MLIDVIQYMRPDGHRVIREAVIPDTYSPIMDLLEKHKLAITCESLMNGMAVQYISHADGDFDICTSKPLGPAKEALLKMLDRFDESEFEQWLKGIR